MSNLTPMQEKALDMISVRGAYPHIADWVPLEQFYAFVDALTADVPVATPADAQVISDLIALARVTHNALDDSEALENGETILSEAHAQKLSDLLTVLELLPEREGFISTGPVKAAYALQHILKLLPNVLHDEIPSLMQARPVQSLATCEVRVAKDGEATPVGFMRFPTILPPRAVMGISTIDTSYASDQGPHLAPCSCDVDKMCDHDADGRPLCDLNHDVEADGDHDQGAQ